MRALTGICILASICAGSAVAQPLPAKVAPLLKEAMAEWPGKELRSFLVEFPPGGESVPHTHLGAIFVYVLKGTWAMQLEGSPLATLREGQVVYERANHKHLVSRNASSTEPLQLVVFYVSDPGAAVSVPIAK
ncbi:MAG: cupin domain-containing protein [Proteobacteria bacterium]|nr:cupin domain-containing protein [Pseudomonadota bacterium]